MTESRHYRTSYVACTAPYRLQIVDTTNRRERAYLRSIGYVRYGQAALAIVIARVESTHAVRRHAFVDLFGWSHDGR